MITKGIRIVLLVILSLSLRNYHHGFVFVNGDATDQACGGSASWVPGGVYGISMSRFIPNYSTNTATCRMTISGGNGPYSPGQEFTATLTSTSSLGMKIESTGGATMSTFSSTPTRVNTAKNCADYNSRKTTVTFKLKAPLKGGKIAVQGLCGNENTVFVSNVLEILPGANVPPADGPGGKSSDPNFDIEIALDSNLKIFYRRTGNQLNVKMTLSKNGYVSLALGRSMVPAVAIVGLDPAANPGSPGVGIYELKGKSGANSQISPLISNAQTLTSTFGVSNAKFTSTGGSSVLEFSIDVTKQDAKFTLTGSGPVDTTWAYGGSAYGDHGPSRGSLLSVDFSSLEIPGGLGGAGFQMNVTLFLHCLFMIIAWAIFSPLGTILPLFNNGKHGKALMKLSQPVWYKYHLIFQLGAFGASLLGFFLGVIYMSSVSNPHFTGGHEVVGLIVVLGSLVQPIHGYCRPPKTKTGSQRSISRMLFDYAHPLIGFFCVIAGIITCLTGITELDKISGGADSFQVGGLGGGLGFSGGLGVISILLALFFLPSIAYGIIRSPYYTYYLRSRKNNSTTLTNPGAVGARDFSSMDVSKHSRENDFYVIYKGKVYDVTKFLNSHPGGKKVMLPFAGKDMTSEFLNVGHSENAVSMLQQYYVGELSGGSTGPEDVKLAIAVDKTILLQTNQEKHQVTLAKKKKISSNSYELKFNFRGAYLKLGLPIGKHICIWTKDGKTMRKYTPTRSDDVGSFTLVVKVYPNGIMSNYLAGLKMGDSITIAGPFGSTEYIGAGIFTKSGSELPQARQIALIAGGSGITPILQILNGVLKDERSKGINISILYANSTVDDILCQEELFSLTLANRESVSLWFTLSKPPSEGWKYSTGRINIEMLQKYVFPRDPSNTICVLCGPEGMMETTKVHLKSLKFPMKQLLEY